MVTIAEKVKFWNGGSYRKDNKISDHSDGKAHRDFIERVVPTLEKKSRIITLTLNFDGVKIFSDSKSRKSIWPFYLAINEVTKTSRYVAAHVRDHFHNILFSDFRFTKFVVHKLEH